MYKLFFLSLIIFFNAPSTASEKVSLYRVFEKTIKNNRTYKNKFTDVELMVVYTSPSGKETAFYGFYDGKGSGEGAFDKGNLWKIRFMPDEPGSWTYAYAWSDSTKGGKGSFECVEENAGKGILRPYEENPHWFAYNDSEPVWLKSYYETGHGSIAQNFDWIVEHVYGRIKDNGYNHVQVNWLLSLCCFGQYYHDGPEPETQDLALYQEGNLYESMNLDVWQRMEQHLNWFNAHDIGVHMFLGVDGSRNEGPPWKNLSAKEKDFFVKYMVARLAPFANLSGWNYVWEVPGDREDEELGFARLVNKYDVFDHLITYEDEFPREHVFDLPVYNFAGVENHQIAAPDKNMERHLWKEPWTHHMACLLAYVGKPVFMIEGNALWRRFWQERTGATQDDLRRSAWACATAGASFTWCGHASEYELMAYGPEGLPFEKDNPYHKSEAYISILTDVMKNEVLFHTMTPHDELLSECPALEVYAMADMGEQYLVFAPDGVSFALKLKAGAYSNNLWINTENGDKVEVAPLVVQDDDKAFSFMAPDNKHDWILIVKKK